MYKKLDESLGNVLGFKLRGEFTEEELKEMSEEISLTASDMGKIHLLLEFEELKKMPESMTMPGVHNFTSRFKEKFAYMACVADKKWQTWWNRFTRFFSTTKVNFYSPRQRQEALDWVRGESETR